MGRMGVRDGLLAGALSLLTIFAIIAMHQLPVAHQRTSTTQNTAATQASTMAVMGDMASMGSMHDPTTAIHHSQQAAATDDKNPLATAPLTSCGIGHHNCLALTARHFVSNSAPLSLATLASPVTVKAPTLLIDNRAVDPPDLNVLSVSRR